MDQHGSVAQHTRRAWVIVLPVAPPLVLPSTHHSVAQVVAHLAARHALVGLLD